MITMKDLNELSITQLQDTKVLIDTLKNPYISI